MDIYDSEDLGSYSQTAELTDFNDYNEPSVSQSFLSPRRSKSYRRERKQFAFSQKILLILLFLSFGLLFMCAYNGVIVSMPAIEGDKSIPDLGKSEASKLFAFGTLAYAIGEFVQGPLTDRLGGRRVLVLSTALPCVFLIGFSFASSYYVFVVIWFVIRFIMPASWLAVNKLVFNWFRSDQFGKVLGIIGTAGMAGSFLADMGLGSLLGLIGDKHWRFIIYIGVVVLAVVTVVEFLFLRETPSISPYRYVKEGTHGGAGVATGVDSDDEEVDIAPTINTLRSLRQSMRSQTTHSVRPLKGSNDSLDSLNMAGVGPYFETPDDLRASEMAQKLLHHIHGTKPEDATELKLPEEEEVPSLLDSFKRFVGSRRFWFCTLVVSLAKFSDELEAVLPQYFKELYLVSTGEAGAVSVVFPTGSAVSILLTGFLLDQMSKRKGYILLLTTQLIGTIAAIGLCALTYFIAVGKLQPTAAADEDSTESLGDVVAPSPFKLAMFLVFLAAVGVSPSWHLLPSLFALKFGGKHETAIIVGIQIGIGYGFASLFQLILSQLVAMDDPKLGWAYQFGIMSIAFVLLLMSMLAFAFFDYKYFKREQRKLELALS